MSYLIKSYQVFSTPRLVLSWGARSQTGAQNPIVQGVLALGTSPFLFCCFFLLIFNFKNTHSTIQYKLAWHITTPPNFFSINFFCYFFWRYDQLKYGTRRATSWHNKMPALLIFLFALLKYGHWSNPQSLFASWHITSPPLSFLISRFCSSLTVMTNKSFLFILSLSVHFHEAIKWSWERPKQN